MVTEDPGSELREALAAQSGIVAFVGAGGKKTAMYRLAAHHPGPMGLTGTVRLADFPESLDATRVVGESGDLTAEVLEAASRSRRVAYAGPIHREGRLNGVAPEFVAELHFRAGFAATYVKAGGARMRWIKAPGEGEPRIPPGVTTVVAVVSARVLGRPFDERIAHRREELGEITGLERGKPIAAEHVAQLLVHPQGAAKGVGEAELVPLINMVDDGDAEGAAREVADRALAKGPPFRRVVLAAMARERPLVAVVGS